MKIAFLGDIALGDHPKCIGYGFGSAYRAEIPHSKSLRLLPSGLEAQIVFGNLEFPLYARKLRAAEQPSVNKMCCRGWPGYADFLRMTGLRVLSVANNHIYQHGDVAFLETLRALDDVGIRTCGTPRDFSGDQVLTVDGVKVAFLGWSDRPRQYFENEPPYNEVNKDACYRAVSEIKSKVDVVCASLHWGVEFLQMPSAQDRDFAHNLIDAGASVVVGHHPHVLREVEQYAGGVIAYSLGNNVCDMLWDDRTRETACLAVEFDLAGGVSNWELYPGKIGEDYFPTYFSGSARLKFLDDLKQRYDDIREESENSTYEQLAERALKRHQRLTAWHFIRNLGRFDKSVLSDAIKNAIRGRLRGSVRSAGTNH
jgi:hypothetical protein